MRITRETDYAVRCVLHLAKAPNKVAVMGEISRTSAIPRSFLAKILQRLVKAGMVRSYRGLKGGFQLTRRPAKITLREVVEAIEGPVALNRCLEEGEGCALSRSCPVHPVWAEASVRLAEALEEYDFARLARAGQRLKKEKSENCKIEAPDPKGAATPEEARHV